MASNSATVQTGTGQAGQSAQGHFQQPNSAHHCKECGLFFDSAKSLEVHLQYHKENLLNKWAAQAHQAQQQAPSSAASDLETNNNTPAGGKQAQIKREFGMSGSGAVAVAAPADSSDAMLAKPNKSPDSYNSRTTPETSSTSFGHPPTPQSYHSAPSPYQSHADAQNNYSPGYQSGGGSQYQPVPVKTERHSPALYGGGGGYLPQHMYQPEQQHMHLQQQQQQQQQHQHQQYFQLENMNYQQEYVVQKMASQQSGSSYRYHPYGQPHHHHQQQQVSSSSPAYPSHGNQPTPSPSPKQCDKCGYVCDSAAQLLDHLNHAHPPTPHYQPHYPHQQPATAAAASSLQGAEDEPQTEILDLDSHKVHHVFQSPEEEEEMKRNGELSHGNPHSVSAMLGGWAGGSPMYHGGGQPEHKPPAMFQPPPPHPPPPPLHHAEYLSQPSSSQELSQLGQYRPYEQLPPQPNPPVISSSGGGAQPPGPPKGANWKSNEARRPKTYNCSACNKWFTSSGHLKRHYNTTLHKNAVKSSGQPDPATLPISAHHHPGRVEEAGRGGGRGQQAVEEREVAEDRAHEEALFERMSAGGYERTPGALNLGPGPGPPPPLLAASPAPLPPLANASPPNGEAGPSATHPDHVTRGLLSISTVSQEVGASPLEGFGMYPAQSPLQDTISSSSSSSSPYPPTMEAMYPNASAPHVTPATATISSSRAPASTSLTITGEELCGAADQLYALVGPPQEAGEPQQPLPSFAQFQQAHHRYGILLAPAYPANVGGAGPHTQDLLFHHPHATALYQQQSPGTPLSQPEPLSPPQHTYAVLESAAGTYQPQQEPKPDYEHGSPLISSTGSPQNGPAVSAAAPTSAAAVEHKCHDCKKVFNKACYLTQHNKTFHSGHRPFKCNRCGKRFASDSSYQEHLAKHAGDKPHKCELCPKQFNHKTDLRRHMCLHTGQKPYACDHCGKGFIRKDHMLKHTETHTRKTHHHAVKAAAAAAASAAAHMHHQATAAS